jgi:thiol:disulfide interchange protein
MKKSICILSFILIGTLGAFGQTVSTGKEKAVAKTAEQPAQEREVFDPKKDPNVDLQQAIAAAKTSGKRIILDIGGEWCGWCRHMDKFFTQNSALNKLREENYIWVKVNMSEENENKEFLSKYPEAKGYPHLYVLETDGMLLQSQDTSELEAEKTYNLEKFTDFLKKWAPTQKTSETVSNPK